MGLSIVAVQLSGGTGRVHANEESFAKSEVYDDLGRTYVVKTIIMVVRSSCRCRAVIG